METAFEEAIKNVGGGDDFSEENKSFNREMLGSTLV